MYRLSFRYFYASSLIAVKLEGCLSPERRLCFQSSLHEVPFIESFHQHRLLLQAPCSSPLLSRKHSGSVPAFLAQTKDLPRSRVKEEIFISACGLWGVVNKRGKEQQQLATGRRRQEHVAAVFLHFHRSGRKLRERPGYKPQAPFSPQHQFYLLKLPTPTKATKNNTTSCGLGFPTASLQGALCVPIAAPSQSFLKSY